MASGFETEEMRAIAESGTGLVPAEVGEDVSFPSPEEEGRLAGI